MGKPRKPTVYEALCTKLGRVPTYEEVKAECRRIIAEAHADLATKGKLPRQRK